MSAIAWRVAVLVGFACAFNACTDEYTSPVDDGTGVHYPLALVADPGQRYIYVVGANFDRAYHGGVVAVLDTVKNAYVAGGRAEVPSFASSAVLDVEALQDGTLRRTLLVAARDDDSITAYDVTDGADGAPRLNCGRSNGDMGLCADGYRLGGDENGDLDLGADPAALALERRPGGEVVLHSVATGDGRVVPLRMAFVAGGGVSATIDETLSLGAGLSGVIHAPLVRRTYLTDARAARLHTIGLDDGSDGKLALTTHAGVTLPAASSREYGRGLALSSDEGRLYVAYRSPNALLVVDVAPLPTGEPHDALVDIIGLGGRPAQVVVAASGPGGRDLVYVSCFGTDDIWVVDPSMRRVIDVIRLAHSPYGMAVVDVPGRGLTLYASLFSKHSIVAVPLAEGASDRHRVVETIQ